MNTALINSYLTFSVIENLLWVLMVLETADTNTPQKGYILKVAHSG